MALAETTQTPWFENPSRACCGASQESFDTFFTETPENLLYVRNNYCYSCPVWQQCEEWSLRNFVKAPHGIFAGWTGEQRKLLLGRRRLRHWRSQDWTSPRFQDRERAQLRMHEVKVVHISGSANWSFNTGQLCCPHCGSTDLNKYGRTANGEQRYLCYQCNGRTFR